MFAVDPTLEVAREAAEWGADLLVVHHPLFLTPGPRVAADHARRAAPSHTLTAGRLRAADRPHQRRPGRRRRLGGDGARRSGSPTSRPSCRRRRAARQARRLRAGRRADAVRDGLADAGRGRLGDYDSCIVLDRAGEGRFRPLDGASPDDRRGRRRSRWSTRCGSRRCCRAVAVGGGARRCWPRTPTRSRRTTWCELADPGLGGHRHRPDRHGRRRRRSSSSPTRVAQALPATAHGVRVAGDPQRVVRRVAVCGGAGDFLLDDRAPAATPTSTSPATCGTTGRPSSSSTTGPPWSTSRTGRPSGPGCRWWRRGCAEALGDTVETRVSTTVHRPLDSSASEAAGEPLKADPPAQLQLLDVAGARRPGRPAAAPAQPPARAGRDRARWRPSAPSSTDQARDARIVVDDLTVEQTKADADVEQVKTRRDARPRPDGPGADHQPQGPRADAARARVARAPDHHARGRRARGDGEARGGAAAARRASASAPTDIDARLAELVAARDEKPVEIDRELDEVVAARGPRGRACPRT